MSCKCAKVTPSTLRGIHETKLFRDLSDFFYSHRLVNALAGHKAHLLTSLPATWIFGWKGLEDLKVVPARLQDADAKY